MTPERLPPWLSALVQARFVVLLLVGTLPGLWHLHTVGAVGDWNFFRDAAQVLVGRGGTSALHLYEASPQTQIGPPALLLALPVALLPATVSPWVAVALIGAFLPVCCYLIERAGDARGAVDDRTALTVLGGGVFVGTYWWRLAADFTHPEDAVAVTAACLVLGWSRSRRGTWLPWIAAALLGTAAAGKPWAVGLLPLVASWPGTPLLRAGRVVAGGLVVVAWWLPFVLAAPGTVHALGAFRVGVWYASPLALIGLAGAPYPEWVRPVQFLLCLSLAALAVARGRGHLAPFVVVAARVALDPQAWDYYFATVALGCLVVDAFRTRLRGPWLTAVTVVVLLDARWMADNRVSAALQVVPLALACVLLVAGPGAVRPLRRRFRRTSSLEGTV
ncbi:hypothetical protein [Kineococcus rhizosphaerae]|uniref:hypothetical protein n=1 Tax=Kineococcus rhizosphaerae TaxID=559628 RepID=UPI0011B1DC67|nr:hypothetical protein [Kineococcus rhizosphaerae]